MCSGILEPRGAPLRMVRQQRRRPGAFPAHSKTHRGREVHVRRPVIERNRGHLEGLRAPGRKATDRECPTGQRLPGFALPRRVLALFAQVCQTRDGRFSHVGALGSK